MIRIFDKEIKQFNNLGLGSLDEAKVAIVTEELNGSYEMEMEYPITGRHFDKIQQRNIIFCKPNPESDEQPFRIYSISKPIDGIVTINAAHISYDASGIVILPLRNEDGGVVSYGDKIDYEIDDKIEEGYLLDTILRDINNNSVIDSKNPFVLRRDLSKDNSFRKNGFSIPAPTSLRSILGGSDESLLSVFKGEYSFDKFDIILQDKRGKDRGITIRYGKNMTGLEQDTDGNSLFSAVFPFYSKSYSETYTSTKPIFLEAYIIPDAIPFSIGWVSIELIDASAGIGGIIMDPKIETVNIIVEGIEKMVQIYAPIRIKTPGKYYDKIYVFKRDVGVDGSYVEALDATLVDPSKPLPKPLPTYPIIYDSNKSKWIQDDQNGHIYVQPRKPNVSTVTEEKYEYRDLKDYVITTGSGILENGILYVNEELKNLQTQKILPLDLTSDLDSIDGLEPRDIKQEHLFNKAEQYLKDNDLTRVKESVTISFIKLSDSSEYKHFKQLEVVELGDEINIVYEKLGVNSKHRVISTEYNVLTNNYNEVELGDNVAVITNNIVSLGDNVSSLKNDASYADKVYVVNLVSENANIVNAEIQKAIISTLEVGTVRISGNITATSGNIGGCEIIDGNLIVSSSISIANETFKVDSNGNMEASSVKITGGTLNINDMFEVDSNGNLIAKNAKIDGNITAMSGNIGGCEIIDGILNISNVNIEDTLTSKHLVGGTITGSTINIGNGTFEVNEEGNVKIEAGFIELGLGEFVVTNDGKLTATDAFITGNVNTETMKTTELRSDKVIINDIVMEYADVDDTQKLTVDFTVSASWYNYDDMVDGTTILIQVNSSAIVWENTLIRVNVRYSGMGLESYISSVDCIMLKDKNTVSKYVYVRGRVDQYSVSAPGSVSFTPGSYTYIKTPTHSTIGIKINSNIYPKEDVKYNLGGPSYKWNDIYAQDDVIKTSDKRQKSNINYDISLYDTLFDKLKPASYKFIDGTSGRKHLGFIAQDVRDSLEESGIIPQDFAGYIKGKKEHIKNKENPTEDDYVYGLRYSELHALEIRQIQLLKTYIIDLEERIKMLEQKC